tara:strand:+ start:335 stop:466 length:132 start_codon:yes stop_codon:yes gene_type:complete
MPANKIASFTFLPNTPLFSRFVIIISSQDILQLKIISERLSAN